MLLRIVAAFLLLVGCVGLPRACTAAGQVRCLLVGVDDYGGPNDLKGCAADAGQVETFLKNRFGAKRTSCKSLVDLPGDGFTVTWDKIEAEIKRIAAQSTADDYFYFYYSGHGASDSSLHLPKSDVRPQQLAAALAKVRSKLTCVIVDSCFSGGLVPSLTKTIKTPRLIVATAVKSDEEAKTCGQGTCPANTTNGSVFTRWLVDAMSARSNDANGDGLVSWREASQVAGRTIAAQRYRKFLENVAGYTAEVERSLEMTPVFFQRL